MAHEINNPLAVIRMSASFVGQALRQIDDPDELHEALSDLELAAERIGIFVQHVTGFVRLAEQRPRRRRRSAPWRWRCGS